MSKSHKQELLDLATDFKSVDEVILTKFSDDRAPDDEATLPKKYVKWVVDALKSKAKGL